MQLQTVDWAIVAGFLLVWLVIGIAVAKKAGESSAEFFLSGRHMPWWLLGVSMVATTFSTDTPNLVTDIVRTGGVAKNWLWWAFLLTGMLTTFVYARLWRRSGVTTDIEFYELRYSGRAAAFLRGFRAIYLGVFFNVVVMAAVTLAAIKIGGVLMDVKPLPTVIFAGGVTVAYTLVGGLTGVLLTDLVQFIAAMAGAICAAIYALGHPAVGGLDNLLNHPEIVPKLSMLPDLGDRELLISVFIIPLAVQWWSVWYPGAEPGGGGYVVQRMLAAKDERHSQGATLFFNFAHYALRPWPWIIVALCSLLVFPDLESLRTAFPNIDPSKLRHDMAYPAMLTFLPAGLLGLVVSSLAAAYMSTIATHLNWGASYVVNDVYKRFVRIGASEKELVAAGRICTLLLMVAAAALSLWLENALQAFQILLQIGAGTGLLFILRWFWWRINAISELTAMVVSFAIALFFQFGYARLGLPELADWHKLLIGVGITTASWVGVTLLTPPADDYTLFRFYQLIRPGAGWKAVIRRGELVGLPLSNLAPKGVIPMGILCMVLGSIAIYGALFGVGAFIYGNWPIGVLLSLLAILGSVAVWRLWPRLDDATGPT